MDLIMYQVDAFADNVFEGNPAAVIPLDKWLPEGTMQQIATENNLSETAFFVPEADRFHIRWFTPVSEVDLCGHATLASAHILFKHMNYSRKEIEFESASGVLRVLKKDDLIVLDFPALNALPVEIPEYLNTAFNYKPVAGFKGRDDLMFVFDSESQIRNLRPDFQKILKADTRGVICTAASEEFDFVSRFFAPAVGVNEDPVTGSAHTMLIPYWAEILNKEQFTAGQLSNRGGVLFCEYRGDRVLIGGRAITYLTGEITI